MDVLMCIIPVCLAILKDQLGDVFLTMLTRFVLFYSHILTFVVMVKMASFTSDTISNDWPTHPYNASHSPWIATAQLFVEPESTRTIFRPLVVSVSVGHLSFTRP
jgi:hypothetical protein